MKALVIAVLALALTLASALPAHAVVYRNPGHGFSQGDFAGGISLEDISRDITSDATDESVELDYDSLAVDLTIGIAQGGALGLHLGTLEGALTVGTQQEPDADGVQFGASYRHNLDAGSNARFQKGILASIRSVVVDNETSETTVTQVDLGIGASLGLSDIAALYGGVVFSQLDGTLDIFAVQAVDFESEDEIGGFVGIELKPGDQLLLGAEAHLLHESGFGLYVDLLF